MTVASENASPAPTISFPISIRLSPLGRPLLDVLGRALHEHVIGPENSVRIAPDYLDAVRFIEALRFDLVVHDPHDLVAGDLALLADVLHFAHIEGELGSGRLPLDCVLNDGAAHLYQIAWPPHRLADGDARGHGIGESKQRNGER